MKTALFLTAFLCAAAPWGEAAGGCDRERSVIRRMLREAQHEAAIEDGTRGKADGPAVSMLLMPQGPAGRRTAEGEAASLSRGTETCKAVLKAAAESTQDLGQSRGFSLAHVPVVKGLKAACATFLNHTGGAAKRGAEEPANTTNTTLEKAKPKRKPRLIRNMAKCISKEDDKLIADYDLDPSKIKRDTVVGGLNCLVLHGGHNPLLGDAKERCPDDLSHSGKFWMVQHDGRAYCYPRKPSEWGDYKGGVHSIHCCCCGNAEGECGPRGKHKDMGRKCRQQPWLNTTTKASMSQKMQLRMISNTAAAIMLKRIAPCEVFEDGSEKCHHVYKTGVCIDCKSKKNDCKWTAPKDLPAQTKWVDTQYRHDKRSHYTRETWGQGYWPANGQSSGDGAQSWGCVPEMWFRSRYKKQRHWKKSTPPPLNPGAPNVAGFVPQPEYYHFAKHCVAAAFEGGKLRPEFACGRADLRKFKRDLKSF